MQTKKDAVGAGAEIEGHASGTVRNGGLWAKKVGRRTAKTHLVLSEGQLTVSNQMMILEARVLQSREDGSKFRLFLCYRVMQ